MAESNVIIKIGSKAIGGFTELRSALLLLEGLKGKVEAILRPLTEFKDMWENTNQVAVAAADKSSDSIIKMDTLMRGWNSGANAGLKITNEQFSILSARAATFAESTGQDANAVFLRMIDSINSGGRGLKEYGIKIENTKNLTDAQNESIKKLTAGFEGAKFSAGDTGDRIEKLNNTLDAFGKLLYTTIPDNESFARSIDSISGAVGELNRLMAESPNTVNKYILSMEGLARYMGEVWRVIKQGVLYLGSDTLANQTDVMSSSQADRDFWKKVYESAEKERQATISRNQEREANRPRQSGLGGGGGGGSKKKFEPYVPKEWEWSMMETSQAEVDWLNKFGPESGEYFDKQFVAGEQLSQAQFDSRARDLQSLLDSQMTVIEKEENLTRTFAEVKAEQLQSGEIEERKESTYTAAEAMDLIAQLAQFDQQIQDQSIGFAYDFGMAWEQALGKISTGSLAAKGMMDILHGTAQASVKAALSGGKTWGAAMRQVVAEIGQAVAVEAGFQALLETAYAIASVARQQYDTAAEHFAAAAAFAATAVVAGGVSYLARDTGNKGGASRQQNQQAEPALPYGQKYYSTQSEQNVTVNVVIKGDAGDFLTTMQSENDRRARNGQTAFARI